MGTIIIKYLFNEPNNDKKSSFKNQVNNYDFLLRNIVNLAIDKWWEVS